MPKRYFAVGLKNWVQVRVGQKPPVPDISEATIPSVVRNVKWHEPDNLHAYPWPTAETNKKDLPIKMTVYKGCRTIKTLPTRYLARVLGISVRDGSMVELLPAHMDILKALKVKRW